MAKQWIREYLKWQAPLATPRENVLVRQIRYEAWKSWNVKAVMWFIPFLLEVAMVFFLGGTVILLWTLDSLVATALTILAAIFLALVSAFTILPIFYQQCPYKAHPSWVLLRFLSLLSRMTGILPFNTAQTWRERELNSFRLTPEARIHLKSEIAEEDTHLRHDGRFHHEPKLHCDVNSDEAIVEQFTQDLFEVSILVSALVWVSGASQDPRIDQYVRHCMQTLHPKTTGTTALHIQTLTNWCIISAICSTRLEDLRQPNSLLTASQRDNPLNPHLLSPVTQLRQAVGVSANITPAISPPELPQITLSCALTKSSLEFELLNPTYQHAYMILNRVIPTTLAIAINVDSKVHHHYWIYDDKILRRIFEMVVLMVHLSKIPRANTNGKSYFQNDSYLQGLYNILSLDDNTRELLDARAPGLRFHAFMLVTKHKKITTNMITGRIGK